MTSACDDCTTHIGNGDEGQRFSKIAVNTQQAGPGGTVEAQQAGPGGTVEAQQAGPRGTVEAQQAGPGGNRKRHWR